MQCNLCSKDIVDTNKLYFWDNPIQYNFSIIKQSQVCEECFNKEMANISINNSEDNKLIENKDESTN